MSAKEEFIEIFREHVHRDGAEALLDYLTNKSDFFTSPASARYHGAYAGGLCEHSLNVYHCLTDYLARERVTDLYGLEYSPESIALVALLHDVCKIGCYKPSTRNVKGEDGKWTQVPTFTYEDPLPYGHGEKSVYVINGFVRLTREEAMAIRWHMGFSGTEDSRSVSLTFRVPQENYASFLAAVAEAGNVTYKNQQADDVTAQYMDVETRLENLKNQRTRLQQLQQQADNLSDLLEIESSLTDVQSQIESWQSQMDWYNDQVEECTVYVSLSEVSTYSPPSEGFGSRFVSALSAGWQNFVDGLQQVIVALAGAWPVVVIAAAACAGFVVWKKKKK